MKVTRERTEILLMEYAAGCLDETGALLAASYITVCPDARRFVRGCESVGGAMIDYCCEPVAMNGGGVRTIMNRIDEIESGQGAPVCAAPRPPAEPADEARCPTTAAFCRSQPMPEPLARHIARNGRAARWHTLYPGFQYYMLPGGNAPAQVTLVNMAPRVRAVRHSHPGTEYTLVLRGGFADEFGSYRAGDLAVIDETGFNHQPVAGDEGCVCLVATAVPVHFTGAIGALLNLMMRL